MTAHLTLVSDRRVETATAEPSSADPIDRSWVHRLWRPRPRAVHRALGRMRSRRAAVALRSERGAVTAEYAVVILGAVAFAGVLVAIMRSNEVRQMLLDLVRNALGAAGG